jgi:hypothetical protein
MSKTCIDLFPSVEEWFERARNIDQEQWNQQSNKFLSHQQKAIGQER